MIDGTSQSRRTRSLVGQIPEPDELYGRDDFIDHLWKLLEGNNVLLLAPRRFGKSGVMRHILLKPHADFLPLSSKLFELIGAPVPYFIHIFFSQLGQAPLGKREKLSAGELEQVYRERVLGPTCRHYFNHYSSRLKRYGKTGERAALAILRAVAGQQRISRPVLHDIYHNARGKGANDQEFDELMADLEYDWYLRLDPDTNEFYFRLKVMQDWWRRWYPPPAAKAKTSTPKRS